MTNARNKTKSHFMAGKMSSKLRAECDSRAEPEDAKATQDSSQKESCARNQSPPLKSVLLRGAGPRFAPWKEAMPEASNRALFPIAPGKMAILAVKLLGNDFDRAKHTNQRRGHEFSSHLWIFDIRRAALRATDKGRGDIRINRLPFDHQVLGILEIRVFHHYFRIRKRARHEANLLQRRLVVNIGPQSGILEAPF